jgi:hypothetical protein
MCTGGNAVRISLPQPLATVPLPADVEMRQALPSSDLRVSTHLYDGVSVI